MDNLSLCHAMEKLCRQGAELNSDRKGRWLREMNEWNERAHTEAAYRFQGRAVELKVEMPGPKTSPLNSRDRRRLNPS